MKSAEGFQCEQNFKPISIFIIIISYSNYEIIIMNYYAIIMQSYMLLFRF
jgi:hypothetical protein